MKYKILGVLIGLGALGYVFREKVVVAVNGLLDKVDVMFEDPSEDPEPEVPDHVDGFGIPGSRAYPKDPPADPDDPVYGTFGTSKSA